jgi:hypothetical protein
MLFKLERFILKWAVSRPSTDAQAARLAAGETEKFAAWSVEERSVNQLLLADFTGRTRSWLMVMPMDNDNSPRTRLYFGSAIVPVKNGKSGQYRFGFIYRSLQRFHRMYSVALLYAAKQNLHKANR